MIQEDPQPEFSPFQSVLCCQVVPVSGRSGTWRRNPVSRHAFLDALPGIGTWQRILLRFLRLWNTEVLERYWVCLPYRVPSKERAESTRRCLGSLKRVLFKDALLLDALTFLPFFWGSGFPFEVAKKTRMQPTWSDNLSDDIRSAACLHVWVGEGRRIASLGLRSSKLGQRWKLSASCT